MNFHKRLHAQFAAQNDEVAKERVLEHRDDEEEAIRVVGACFPDLPGIEDEVLAQDGKLNRLSGIAQILQ